MIDISGTATGDDLHMADTQIPKAANVLSVQLGSLDYSDEFGIDLAYFLSEDFKFENESFKSYLIERLANSGIDVTGVMTMVETLYSKYTFSIGNEQTTTSLIAR